MRRYSIFRDTLLRRDHNACLPSLVLPEELQPVVAKADFMFVVYEIRQLEDFRVDNMVDQEGQRQQGAHGPFERAIFCLFTNP